VQRKEGFREQVKTSHYDLDKKKGEKGARYKVKQIRGGNGMVTGAWAQSWGWRKGRKGWAAQRADTEISQRERGRPGEGRKPGRKGGG